MPLVSWGFLGVWAGRGASPAQTPIGPNPRMARGGLEPPTPRFSVVGRPALTRSAEGSKKWPFAGSFGTPSAVAADRAVHRNTGGYVRITVGLCRDAGVCDTNPRCRSSGMKGRLLAPHFLEVSARRKSGKRPAAKSK
jgi:hypothetical protein